MAAESDSQDKTFIARYDNRRIRFSTSSVSIIRGSSRSLIRFAFDYLENKRKTVENVMDSWRSDIYLYTHKTHTHSILYITHIIYAECLRFLTLLPFCGFLDKSAIAFMRQI